MGKVIPPPVGAPVPIADAHNVQNFRCSEPSLERWLKGRARKNQQSGASRTFVVCAGSDVVGYYCLSAGAVTHEMATGGLKRNMPDPIPAVVLGRLAVHTDWMGRGIGRGLLKDAILRTLSLADELGIRVLLCHALDERAKRFYIEQGFAESPIDPLVVMLNIAALGAQGPRSMGGASA